MGSLYLTRFIGGAYDFSVYVFTLKIIGCLITVFWLFKLFHVIIIKTSSSKVKQWSLLLISLAILLALTEIGFMFVARTFATSYPLADQNWERRYWNPINKLGYRAPNIDSVAIMDKKNILVVGSSYTSGGGIDRIEDRFTEKLGEQLPEKYIVHNLGMSGTEICDGFKRLNEYIVDPDILIISHTTKSIKALMDMDIKQKVGFNLHEQLDPVTGFFVNGSHLLNYLFWKFYAPDKLMQLYLANIDSTPISLYRNKAKLREHFKNLQKFVDYCEDKSIPLIVISFPSMSQYIGLTDSLVSKPIEQFFKNQNIPAISVFDLVRDIPVQLRAVNSTDMHPSVEVNRRIADELYLVLKENKMIP